MNIRNFQPGIILDEVILGAFKASGISFDEWCRANDVNPAAARSALKGFSTGTQGQAVIGKLVDPRLRALPCRPLRSGRLLGGAGKHSRWR